MVLQNEPLHRLVALVLLVGSLVAVFWLERDTDWGERLRSRLVMGVPWGTLVVVLFVVSVYLFLQDGLNHWADPVTVPYSAWSYFYPLGMVTAAFAHDGPSHLIGNMTATVVLLPLAEYTFGHFPVSRGTTSFGSLRENPWVRALVLFPAGVLFVGLLTALWSWGPIIGFSGVVFAALGFAVVRYPLATVVAIAAQGVVVTLYRSMLEPVIVRQASRRFVRPGWAGIAVQGHALGLFLGVTAAVWLLWRRGNLRSERPRPLRLWLGTLLTAMSLGLWQLWWIRGPGRYVLYRALGLGFVLVVGLVVTWVVVASDRDLLAGVPPDWGPLRRLGAREMRVGLPRRQVAVALLLVPLLVMAGVAAGLNLNRVEQGPPEGSNPVEVRDYTVIYAENVPSRMYNVIQVELFGATTQVNASGVIVISQQRNVWTREVSPGELAASGRAEVVLGGPTWRETVLAVRRGWSAVGGGATYKVWLGPKGGPYRLAFVSEPAQAEAVVAGYNVSVVADRGGFFLRLSVNGTAVARGKIPGRNETLVLRNVTFTRDGKRVLATHENTTVPVAKKETY